MFRSYDHPHEHILLQFKTLIVSVLKCNFSKEQSILPEDYRMIETCRSVLISILDY